MYEPNKVLMVSVLLLLAALVHVVCNYICGERNHRYAETGKHAPEHGGSREDGVFPPCL